MIERAIATLLLSALWQPVAVAAVAFAFLRLGARASAATRCAVLTAALVAAVALPIATAFFLYSPATHAAAMTHPIIESRRAVFTVSPQSVLFIVFAWCAIALVLLARLAVSVAHLTRLRRNALPMPLETRKQLDCSAHGVRVCLSDDTAVPIAVGIFDAMVVLPRTLLDELNASDLNRIVQHEIAHVRRHDALIYLLQQISAALFFFSPGLRWIAKSLDVEREVACDDWVLHRSSEPAPYASCLVRLAERTAWPHRPLPAPGAFATRRSMSIRVERILQRARDARLYAAPGPVIAALAFIGAIAIAGLSVEPSLAYATICTERFAKAWTPAAETFEAFSAPPRRIKLDRSVSTPNSDESQADSRIPLRFPNLL